MSRLPRDDRAVSTTVNYALTLAITTLLITGLLVAGGDFVQGQRKQAALSELRVLGQQLAGDVAATDRLARSADGNGTVSVRRSLPDKVAGSNYRVNATRATGRNVTVLHLSSDSPEERSDVRVYTSSSVFMKRNLTGGDATIAYNPVRERLSLRPAGPYVFQESGGQVVIEAESFPEYHPGKPRTNASDHYWKAFSDSDASGDMAVVVRPNTGANTYDNAYGPRLDYRVHFKSTGTYYVWVHMKGTSGNDNSVHVGLQEDPQPASFGGPGSNGLGVTADSNWHWVDTIEADGSPVTVTPSSTGTKTLSIWMREDGTQVDKIVLKKTDTAPAGDGPSESGWG